MKPLLPLLLVLLSTAPAVAQSRFYTNADLGKPLASPQPVPPDELEWLKAHQYQAPPTPTREMEPGIFILPHDPDWPFRTSTLDDIRRPFPEPWYMTTYLGLGYWPGYGSYGLRAWSSPHMRATAPPRQPEPRLVIRQQYPSVTIAPPVPPGKFTRELR